MAYSFVDVKEILYMALILSLTLGVFMYSEADTRFDK